jgi:hypothetical protein
MTNVIISHCEITKMTFFAVKRTNDGYIVNITKVTVWSIFIFSLKRVISLYEDFLTIRDNHIEDCIQDYSLNTVLIPNCSLHCIALINPNEISKETTTTKKKR